MKLRKILLFLVFVLFSSSVQAYTVESTSTSEFYQNPEDAELYFPMYPLSSTKFV